MHLCVFHFPGGRGGGGLGLRRYHLHSKKKTRRVSYLMGVLETDTNEYVYIHIVHALVAMPKQQALPSGLASNLFETRGSKFEYSV